METEFTVGLDLPERASPPSLLSGRAMASSDRVPAAAALSDGLLTVLAPMVDKVDGGIQQAVDSQAMLSQQIDRVAAELQSFLTTSQLPSFAPYAHRLAEVRRRTAVASGTLQQVQARLSRVEAIADQLQAEELHLLPAGLGSSSSVTPSVIATPRPPLSGGG